MATATSEKPLLFSGPMVRAILAGQKTVTRRIAVRKGWDITSVNPHGLPITQRGGGKGFAAVQTEVWECPYGEPGDQLWVREAWQFKNWTDGECAKAGCPDAAKHPTETYLGEPTRAIYRASYNECIGDPGPWKPSIHMPRWASRITLEVTGLRVERLQNVSHDDVLAEGTQVPVTEDGSLVCRVSGKFTPSSYWPCDTWDELKRRDDFEQQWFRCHFASLWDELNASRGFSWDSNPWVWVVSFRRVD